MSWRDRIANAILGGKVGGVPLGALAATDQYGAQP